MKKLLSYIIAAALGFWVADMFVLGVEITIFPNSSFFGIPLTAVWHLLLVLGIILGLLNYFVKPILSALTLPLRIITLGLFDLIINMALIWIIDIMFEELSVPFLLPLLYTSLIIFALNMIVSSVFGKKW